MALRVADFFRGKVTGGRILILAGLLLGFLPSASADTIQYSASGTFSASTPTSAFSGPSETWAFSFQADSKPVVSNVLSGDSFDLAFSNFAFFLNGSPDALTPTAIAFVNSAFTGGFEICFGPCTTTGLGDSGAQMYTVPESAPTLLPGVFPSTPGESSIAVNGIFYTEPDITVTATLVPEPSSLLLLGMGLLGLMAMSGFATLRKQVGT